MTTKPHQIAWTNRVTSEGQKPPEMMEEFIAGWDAAIMLIVDERLVPTTTSSITPADLFSTGKPPEKGRI